VFDHVEAGRVLEQPAGKDLVPGQRLVGILALFDIDLDKGAGFGRVFPRQGAFAAGQLDHHVADPPGFAGLEHQVLLEVVALVEQAQRRDAVLDRGAVFAFHRRRAGRAARGNGIGDIGGGRLGAFVLAPAAASQRKQQG
jgi:hypothetical protein